MSCYEWERGTLKIPSAEYPTFRKTIIIAYNTLKTNTYNIACYQLEKIKQATKGLKKENKAKLANEILEKNVSPTELYDVQNMIFAFDQKRLFKGFKTPKKKDIGLLPISKQASLLFEDACISFDDKNKTVSWDVGENNHAVEHSRSHILGKLFFKLLHSMHWTRNSGGVIIGNDEYNRDSYYEGGGANYVKDRFGPLGGQNTLSSGIRSTAILPPWWEKTK